MTPLHSSTEDIGYTKLYIEHDNKHERYGIWAQTLSLSLSKKLQHFKWIIIFLHDKIA